MILRIVMLSFLLFASGLAFGQNENDFVEDKTELLRHEITFGAMIHSNGWGVNVKRSKNKTAYNKFMYEVDIVGMSNPKEHKTTNPYYDNEGSYVYGKLNSLLLVRTGAGFQKTIYGKGEKGGIEVRMCYSAGASWGIIKPVYLDILKPSNTSPRGVSTVKYDPEKHTMDNILGQASFTNGLNELNLNIGAYGKFGFAFEFGSKETSVRIVETGISVDGFLKPVELMAFIENNPAFLSFYVNILWGKKW